MELSRPPTDVGLAGLRALKTVALADGTLHDLERAWMDSVQENILGTKFHLDELAPITGAELAAAVPPGEYRERILRAAILIALLDTEASAAEEAVLSDFAEALGVDQAPLKALQRVASGSLRMLRFDVARRSFIAKRFSQHASDKGLRGIAEIVAALAGMENESLAARYRVLENFPTGTLGRAYHDFIKANGFGLPGEKGGAPEPIVFHDCVHVLAEYGTTPEEEVLVVSFQAGFQRYDPFFTMLFVVAQFHLGIQISPVAGTTKNAIDAGGMVRALVRGTHCSRDLSDGWDPWDDFGRMTDDVRRDYNILPRA